MDEAPRVRWGILGPGRIARDFLQGATGSDTGVVAAVGTRDPGRAGLSDDFPGVRILAGYDRLIEDPDLDAIYIATPHSLHAEWAIRAAHQGKHVLCEKPMGLTAAEVDAMFAASDRHGVFMSEAFMYRLHPLTLRIIDLMRAGVIGELRALKSSYGFAMQGVDPEHRLLNPRLGGGAILDVGGYPISMIRLLAGYREAKPLDPVTIEAAAHIGLTGVDEWSAAVLAFPNGIIGEAACAIRVRQDNVLHLFGSEGRLEIDQFWFGGGKAGGVNRIRVFDALGTRGIVPVADERNLYSYQFEAANRAIRAASRSFAWPAMSRADSQGNAHTLDLWRAKVGLPSGSRSPFNPEADGRGPCSSGRPSPP